MDERMPNADPADAAAAAGKGAIDFAAYLDSTIAVLQQAGREAKRLENGRGLQLDDRPIHMAQMLPEMSPVATLRTRLYEERADIAEMAATLRANLGLVLTAHMAFCSEDGHRWLTARWDVSQGDAQEFGEWLLQFAELADALSIDSASSPAAATNAHTD